MSGLYGIRPSLPPLTGSPQERINQIVAKLKERGVQSDYCPRCNVFDWSVDFLQMPAAPERDAYAALFGHTTPFSTSPGFIPVACFACKNCGYMLYHDLRVLENPR
jgi:hypothetical protein